MTRFVEGCDRGASMQRSRGRKQTVREWPAVRNTKSVTSRRKAASPVQQGRRRSRRQQPAEDRAGVEGGALGAPRPASLLWKMLGVPIRFEIWIDPAVDHE